MPGRGGRLPKLIEDWAGRIILEYKKRGKKIDKSRAIAIAVSQAQKKRYLHKKTLKLTKLGRKASKKYYGKKLPIEL